MHVYIFYKLHLNEKILLLSMAGDIFGRTLFYSYMLSLL